MMGNFHDGMYDDDDLGGTHFSLFPIDRFPHFHLHDLFHSTASGHELYHFLSIVFLFERFPRMMDREGFFVLCT